VGVAVTVTAGNGAAVTVFVGAGTEHAVRIGVRRTAAMAIRYRAIFTSSRLSSRESVGQVVRDV